MQFKFGVRIFEHTRVVMDLAETVAGWLHSSPFAMKASLLDRTVKMILSDVNTTRYLIKHSLLETILVIEYNRN